jgi:MFS family permease
VNGGGLRSALRALAHRNFRLFWIGQLISLVGTWMQSVAQGWLMHRLTSSPFMLGLLGFAQFFPVMVLTLWAGALADHMDKRMLIIATQTLFLIQAAALGLVVTLGIVQPWMVIALALVFGTISAFDLPARQSFLAEMVAREDLPNAIALNSGAFNTARVFGPAVAGIVLGALGGGPTGEAACFWINAVSYVAVLAMLFRMDLPRRVAEPGGHAAALSTLRDGIDYARRTRPIRNLLLLLGVTAGLGFQYMVLLPVYARDILHSDARGYGLMVSAFGLGSLLAAATLTRQQDRWALRRNLLIGLGSSGIGLAVFAWSRVLWLTLAMGFAAGFGLILYVASTNTMLQLSTEDRYRGRIMGLYTFMFIGTAPLGALASGWIAQHWGAPLATSFSALILLGGATWMAFRLRTIAAREAAERAAVPAFTEKMG